MENDPSRSPVWREMRRQGGDNPDALIDLVRLWIVAGRPPGKEPWEYARVGRADAVLATRGDALRYGAHLCPIVAERRLEALRAVQLDDARDVVLGRVEADPDLVETMRAVLRRHAERAEARGPNPN